VIVDSAKTQVLAAKTLGQGKTLPGITEDTEEFTEAIERPKSGVFQQRAFKSNREVRMILPNWFECTEPEQMREA
jgi:hypothetical protein